MNLLDDLVAKSLLVSERIDGAARFRMLEPVRQYAENRLAASGDADQIRHRHLEHYVEWAEQWRTEIPISGLGWRHRVERDFANLRAAFDWARANADTQSAGRIVTALEFAHLYLQVFEVGEWAERTLQMPAIDELLEGPGVARVVAYRRWWLADLAGVVKLLRRAEQMPAIERYGGSPGPDRTRAFVREMQARAVGDARAAIEAYDDVDRSDAFVEGRVAMQRLAWPPDVLNEAWAATGGGRGAPSDRSLGELDRKCAVCCATAPPPGRRLARHGGLSSSCQRSPSGDRRCARCGRHALRAVQREHAGERPCAVRRRPAPRSGHDRSDADRATRRRTSRGPVDAAGRNRWDPVSPGPGSARARHPARVAGQSVGWRPHPRRGASREGARQHS